MEKKIFMGKKHEKFDLLTCVMIGFVFITTLFGCINIYKSCKIINNQANDHLISLADSVRQRENNYFRGAEEEAEDCKETIDITINNNQLNKIAPMAYKYDKYKVPYVGNYLNSVISPLLLYSAHHVAGIRSIYLIFNPEYFTHKDVLGIWYTDLKHKGDFKLTDNGPITDMYPENKSYLEWYYIPKKLKKGTWSRPYRDNDIKIDMITYSTPVYSGKIFLGITGVDLSIDEIKNFIYQFKIYKTGKAYLIDKNNKIIFAKDYKTLTNTDVIDKNLYAFLNKSLTKGVIKLKDGEIKLIKSSSSKKLFAITQLYNGFVLVLEVPVNELYAETIKLSTLTSFLLVLAVIVVILITVWANRQIKAVNNELIHKEEYTRTLLDSIKDGIIVISDDFVIDSCNPSIEDIWGYSPSEVIGKKLNLLLHHECENEEKKVCLSNKAPFGIKKNGEEFPVEIDVSEIIIEGKKLTLLVIRDITERKKIEKMKNEFVSTVSHELRTPLTSIKGSLGLVTSGVFGVFPEKVNELLNIANINCTRLTNLINDILDLEKIKAGKYEFIYEELEINSLIEQSVILNQSYADQFGMKLKVIKLAEESYIKADKNRILQVLSNLISNAVKFSKLGGEVTITSENENGKIKISVKDKGIGIPDESKYKIFSVFSQVDSSDTKSKGGTGLGLSISKLITENMGGEIGFDSVAGEGSTFFFIMPTIVKGSIIKSDEGEIKELSGEAELW